MVSLNRVELRERGDLSRSCGYRQWIGLYMNWVKASTDSVLLQVFFKQCGDISETSKVEVYCLWKYIFINLISSQMSVKYLEVCVCVCVCVFVCVCVCFPPKTLKVSSLSLFSAIKGDRKILSFVESPELLYAFPWCHFVRP
jgi:hypothetical protein